MVYGYLHDMLIHRVALFETESLVVYIAWNIAMFT